MPNKNNLVGQKFGRLTVIEKVGYKYSNTGHKDIVWKCECDCGNSTQTITPYLKRGTTKSCGCLKNETLNYHNFKHGLSNYKLYSVWSGMKDRCYRENCDSYKHYGKRGISMCNEWKCSFDLFHDWAVQNGYQQGLTIERINVNGNYEPSNCTWIPKSEQSKNRRSNHYIAYKEQIHTISEWAIIIGVSRNIVRYYIDKFKDDEPYAIQYIYENIRK